MLRRKRMTRPVVWAVTLAMTLVLSTNCLTAIDMTPEQKACCAAMAHDCGEMAVEQGCCAGEAAKVDGIVGATPTELGAAPIPVLVAVLEPPATVDRDASVLSGRSGLSLKPPGVPTYLLVSTFRI